MPRRANRRDDNEPEIVEALRRQGCDVWLLEAPAPFDLLVGVPWEKRFVCLEVKNPGTNRNSNQSKDGLQASQVEFFARCGTKSYPAAIVRTPNDALRAVGVETRAPTKKPGEKKHAEEAS